MEELRDVDCAEGAVLQQALSNLEAVVRAGEFIEHVASDMLDLRKIEEGKITLEIDLIDVAALVTGISKALQSKVAETSVAFQVDVSPWLPPFRSDRYRVEQILMNYLTNAFKHTQAGCVTLSCNALFDGSMVELAVTDTGRGIPLAKQGALFAPFEQVSAVRDASLGGFGLGLHLCAMLARLLHGEVGFESEEGRGSRFWVRLPAEENSSIEHQFVRNEVLIL